MAIRESEAAQAIAFFEASDDLVLLHRLLQELAPRVRKIVARQIAKGGEGSIPPPASIRAAATLASADEATAIVEATEDFGLLQALARAIGRRVEALEIVESARYPAGARVTVPATVAFPPRPPFVNGEVVATGTSLRVTLDGGTSWQGPPSLARPAPPDEGAQSRD